MKVLILLIFTVISGYTFAQGAGDLDLDFSVDGKLIVEHNLGSIPPTGEGDEYARAIYVYPDGSMLIGGHAYHTNEQNIDMVVTKVLSTGLIDTTWGGAGAGHVVVGFDLGGSNQDYLYDLHVDPNGNILLIGEAEFLGDDTDFAIARLTPTGAMDTTFSGDGKKTFHFDDGGTNGDTAHSAYAFSHSIYVAGYATQSTGTDFAITKLLNDGTIDTGFGTDGRVTIDFSHSSNSIDKALKFVPSNLSTGFWVLGSANENDNSNSPAIAKIDFAGNLESSFSADGMYVFADSRGGSTIDDAIQKPGTDEFVFVGSDSHPENGSAKDDCALTYVNTISTNNGEPVGDTFNFNLDPNPFIFEFNSDCNSAVFSDTNLKLVLTGNLYPDNISSISMGVMRLNSINVTNGSSSHSIDSGFATNGRKAIAFGGTGQVVDSPSAVSLDLNQNIIVAGTATNQNAVQKFGVARLNGLDSANPVVSILAPVTGSQFGQSDQVTFIGTANDVLDGDISNNIQWESSLDGVLGTGGIYNNSSLSVGTHTITANITDSNNNSDSSQISISIQVNTDLIFKNSFE